MHTLVFSYRFSMTAQFFRNAVMLFFVVATVIAPSASVAGVALGGLMNHVSVNVGAPVSGQFPLVAAFDDDPGNGIEMVWGEANLASPYDLLSDHAYNAQYGWLRQGIWSPGAGQGAFIELVDQSEGLRAYEGGYSVDVTGGGLSDDLNGTHTFSPIFGTEGSSSWWRWDGRMAHNWYVSDQAGPHFATYDVFVADVLPDGSPGALSNLLLPTQITFTWVDSLTPLALPGDYDRNNFVSQSDLDLVLLNWGSSVLPSGWLAVEQFDGVLISQNELDAVLLNWGSGEQPVFAAAVPEPGVLACMLFSLGLFGSRRSKGHTTRTKGCIS